MALPGSKISKKEARRLRKQKFSPLKPGIKNKLQLRKAVNRRAEGVIRPKLSALNAEGVKESQAHQGRAKDLTGYYNYFQDRVGDAYNRAQEALEQVLASTAGGNEATQANFLAAMEQSRSADRAQAENVGGVLPEGLGDDVAAMAAGAGASSLANLANIQSGTAVRAAGRIGDVALGRTRALEREGSRHAASQTQLRKQRTDILKELPTAREEARKDILDEELARAAEREREKIARGTLNLDKRAQKETERSNRAQEAISWAGIRTERQAIQSQVRKEVESATSEAEKAAAEARGEQYNRGVEIFQRYFENTKRKAWDPATLYRNLTLAVPPEMARKIMSHGPPRFQGYANKRGSGGKKSEGPYKGSKPGLSK